MGSYIITPAQVRKMRIIHLKLSAARFATPRVLSSSTLSPTEVSNAIFAPPAYWIPTQLVAAATIAFESINNAAVMARINADIRVQEALLSKAEAKQVLDRLNNLVTSGNGTGENGRHEAKGCSSQPSDADD
ncbi:uncharacterized protein LOC132043123 isoform X4 [Lycium ferocissimum]|uniref:uncharacterized protein LOC132043123 isoform X4 n=1 Tax=Lycium ferocissimum TaxID=112874 RepID=UPI002814DA80|nr:uncharacterized protein LOC132043123 isoform X4 [Lycium ferocissimum]